MKIKLNDVIYEYALRGEAPNGILVLGFEEFDYGGDWIFDQLYYGFDLRCIVEIGSSKYSFTIESGNFSTLVDDAGFSFAPAQMTTRDAVNACLDDGTEVDHATGFFTTHREDYELLKSEDINDFLQGDILHILFSPGHSSYWSIYRYGDGVQRHMASMQVSAVGRGRSYVTYDGEGDERYAGGKGPYSTEGDLYLSGTRGIEGNPNYQYQMRKLSEEICIAYERDDNGEYTIPHLLMIRYDGGSIIQEMVSYIKTVLVPQIES